MLHNMSLDWRRGRAAWAKQTNSLNKATGMKLSKEEGAGPADWGKGGHFAVDGNKSNFRIFNDMAMFVLLVHTSTYKWLCNSL